MNSSILCVLILATSAGLASAQSGDDQVTSSDPPPTRPVYWCVTNQPHPEQNWAGNVDFAGINFRQDVVILYQYQLGIFPYMGPHRLKLDPSWMPKHLAKIQTDLDKLIPDPNYAGLAIIDYEHWNLTWERTRNKPGEADLFAHDQDYQDDWREYIRTYRPEILHGLNDTQREQIFKKTYESCAKEIYLATLAECRRVRPKAQWSFFAYPVLRYKRPSELPPGVIGYGDLTTDASAFNDGLQWLWEAEDFICPALYAPRITVPEKQKRSDGENWPSQNVRFISSNIAEAKRVSGGKPVYPVIWSHYTIRDQGFPWLNTLNTEISFELILNSADGVIFWDNISVEWYGPQLQDWIREELAPILLRIDPRLASDENGDDVANETEAEDLDKNPSNEGVRSYGGGVVSSVPDRPGAPTKATKTSTRVSTRVPAIPFNPRTDRISKPGLTPEELREAIRRAKELRESTKNKDEDKDRDKDEDENKDD